MNARAAAAQIFVALVRGINVGRAKRISMADLRALIEAQGYRSVRTLLNSGNAVFTGSGTTERASALLEAALTERLGSTTRVVVLGAAELDQIVAENPLGDISDDPKRLFVAVLADPNDRAAIAPFQAQDWSPETVATGTRAVYLWCPEGLLASRSPEALGRLLTDSVTTRNWATVLKVHALLEASTPA